MPLPKSNERYTYADYLTWDANLRCELVHGKVYELFSHSNPHQDVLLEIACQLLSYLDGKRCTAMIAPSDVMPFAKPDDYPEDVDTVVQPDIYVVGDPAKLESNCGCIGAPDMVLEIISPITASHDMLVKVDLYAEAGIQEYWVVDPICQEVTVLLLNAHSGRFDIQGTYTKEDKVKVNILNDCTIDLSKVFDGKPESPDLQCHKPAGVLGNH